MEYILMDVCGADIFDREFSSPEEAIRAGAAEWARLTDADKRRRAGYYVLKSINSDPTAPNHYDGEILQKWK